MKTFNEFLNESSIINNSNMVVDLKIVKNDLYLIDLLYVTAESIAKTLKQNKVKYTYNYNTVNKSKRPGAFPLQHIEISNMSKDEFEEMFPRAAVVVKK
jgi:hypothetical protein